MTEGKRFIQVATKHIGERYVLGSMAPKDNASWRGPWDCAEFVSWVAYQVTGKLYGCSSNKGKPSSADSYTGYWARDAKTILAKVPVMEAIQTAGAILLRIPSEGLMGHIVFSDGHGGTVEAHSTKRGVIASTTTDRRWDVGLLLPDIDYHLKDAPIDPIQTLDILRFTKPVMTGTRVTQLQRALKENGVSPGPIDGEFGAQTAAAVAAFQLMRGLVPDGEAGPKTLKALGL